MKLNRKKTLIDIIALGWEWLAYLIVVSVIALALLEMLNV